MNSVTDRWKAVLAQVKSRQDKEAGKPPATLIAVSKGHAAEALRALLEAGQRDFGENRIQEAVAKWLPLKALYPDLTLHLIGALQTNKVKEALALFDVIHTMDRESLVDALAKAEPPPATRFFIQVNTGEEMQKGGVSPQACVTFVEYCRKAKLPVSGLMCIPPAGDLPAPHFALLRTLAETFGLRSLSMGMSGDYETALRLGATHIRVGTAIFGARAP